MSDDDMTLPVDGTGEDETVASTSADSEHLTLQNDRPDLGVFVNGEVVGGRYRITRRIARGGMGEVYEAEDLELAQRVALKTIRQQFSDDPDCMQRFRDEIRVAHRVTHPNISRIYDLCFHETEAGKRVDFFTMELLEGESLASLLRRRGRLEAAEVEPILRQVLAAVGAVHAEGIVHRDLKAANIILVDGSHGGEQRVVVADLGLALTRSGSVEECRQTAGTPTAMAPEQLEGGPTDARCDIFALGVL